MNKAYAEYLVKCAEKERDELEYRIAHAAPNDAIRITGPGMLSSYKDKIANAKALTGETDEGRIAEPQERIVASSLTRATRGGR